MTAFHVWTDQVEKAEGKRIVASNEEGAADCYIEDFLEGREEETEMDGVIIHVEDKSGTVTNFKIDIDFQPTWYVRQVPSEEKKP